MNRTDLDQIEAIDRCNAFELGFLKAAHDAGLSEAEYRKMRKAAEDAIAKTPYFSFGPAQKNLWSRVNAINSQRPLVNAKQVWDDDQRWEARAGTVQNANLNDAEWSARDKIFKHRDMDRITRLSAYQPILPIASQIAHVTRATLANNPGVSEAAVDALENGVQAVAGTGDTLARAWTDPKFWKSR